MDREEAIREVSKCVLKDRNKQYGDPEDNFKKTAAIWNVILKGILKEESVVESWHVAACMAGLKLTRVADNPTYHDSWVDLAGYAVCGAEVASKPKQEEEIGSPAIKVETDEIKTKTDYQKTVIRDDDW